MMVHQIYRVEFSQLHSPRVRRFHEYWKARRGAEHAIPLRASVDPSELRELLPNIVILEVEPEPLRLRYRLVGTRVVEFNKLDFTGLYLGSIGWEEEQQLVDTCVEVVASRQPLCGFYSWTLTTGAIGRCEFGIFPFSQDGEAVTQIFGIEDYEFPRDHGGTRSRAPL